MRIPGAGISSKPIGIAGKTSALRSTLLPEQQIQCLSDFVKRVHGIGEGWRIGEHKELWFRGEGEEHKNSILRPQLFIALRRAAQL